MGRLLRAECGDRSGHGLGVRAFVDGDDLVVLLGLVEARGQRIQCLTELAAHGVPPLNFGLGRGRDTSTARHSNRRCGVEQNSARDHLGSPSNGTVWTSGCRPFYPTCSLVILTRFILIILGRIEEGRYANL